MTHSDVPDPPGDAIPTLEAVPALSAASAAEPVMPDALRRALDMELEVEALPPDMRPYPRLPDGHFQAVEVSGRILAYASPDSTWAVTERLVDAARSTIVVGIYDFRADYVKDALKRAMRRGVRLSLMLDTNTADEPGLFAELRGLGAECVRAPSSSASHPSPYFGNAHEKIIVVDGEIVMIQSGNWSENSIPQNRGDGTIVDQFLEGNRDMGLAIHSRELATLFSDLVIRDMRLAQDLPPDTVVAAPRPASLGPTAPQLFFEAAPPAAPPRLFPSLSMAPGERVRITPAVTPENFVDVLRPLLASATRSVRLEQQYIRGGQPAVDAMLDVIREARDANPGLQVKIVVSPKYLYGAKRIAFEAAMRDRGFGFGSSYRYLSSTHFVHCHNKLVVVDDTKVLIGSQNWSTTGLLSNREASLLVEHAGLTGYFAQIFDEDWRLSEPGAAPPDAVPPGEVDVEAFVQGRAVVSSIRDYFPS